MTTSTFTTVIDHTATAGFRVWGAEFKAALAAVGMVQTSDTGQIDWTTVAYTATINTAQGYEVWRTVDSNLYYKFEYGTGAVATAPGIYVTIGTGSNGSGTITGQTSTRNKIVSDLAPTSTSTTYNSRFASGAGYLNIVWKANGASSSNSHNAMLISGRTVDSAGALTSIGFGTFRASGTAWGFQSIRTASTATSLTEITHSGASGAGLSCVPGNVLSSLDSQGRNQGYIWLQNVKEVLPWKWSCTTVTAEMIYGQSFTMPLIGTTNTYLCIAASSTQTRVAGQDTNFGATSIYTIAMLYE